MADLAQLVRSARRWYRARARFGRLIGWRLDGGYSLNDKHLDRFRTEARQWADRTLAEERAGHLFVSVPAQWLGGESDG